MTKLLASVMSAEEARIAFECGADIIDCKDPSSGALGALDDETVTAIVRYIAGRCPVSATIGDLPMQPYLINEAVKSKNATGVDYIKVGIFLNSSPSSAHNPIGSTDLSESSHRRKPVSRILLDSGLRRNDGLGKPLLCLETLAALADRTALVAVLFADQKPDFDLLPLLARSGFAGVMLDTANKTGGGLMSHVSYTFLRQFVSLAQESGLIAGLAGSLKTEHLPRLLEFGPDYVGFRGALCENARASVIRRDKVTAIVNVISGISANGCTATTNI